MYDAATALCKLLTQLQIAIDGGKDSLSMAARSPLPVQEKGQSSAESTELVKAPGEWSE
jgi:hypothetical protein